MALSNWDTLAVNEEGKSITGTFISPSGVVVEIYKNYIAVRDPQAWKEGCGFSEPTIMVVNEGNFTYKDVQILATRGPKEGIYLAVTSGHFSDKTLKCMLGIGCYGFDVDKWVGIEDREIDYLQSKLEKWAYNYDIDPEVAKISLDKSTRYNQGDAYFANNLGTDIPNSPPGKSDEPMILDVIGKITGENE